ncbi:hypothetical protein SUGI_0633220 [Cryptomeria japonica]|nr:hypothetical protein SUGI_0633200 [Cryptomeria japonica]GLJ31555.1 hypothetical protein SUGI_0633220 [Cryptomeria japonica]
MGRDEIFWKDAQQFKPERFIGSNKDETVEWAMSELVVLEISSRGASSYPSWSMSHELLLKNPAMLTPATSAVGNVDSCNL